MKAKVEKLCGCRDATGRKYPRAKCPELVGRSHGSWCFRFRVPKELVALVGQAEMSGSGYATKKKAEDAAEEAVAKVRAGQQAIGGLTVGTYLVEQWLPGKRKLRPTTAARYGDFVRLYLVPYLGDVPLGALRSHHIAKAFERIEETNPTRRRPVGPATVKDIYDMVKTALGDAVDQRMIPFNPALGVELPEYETPEVEPWGAEEVGRFLDEAAGDRLSALYELVALHGLRRGEACGASWQGLDDEASVLTVSRQIVRSNGVLGVWPPKTRSGKRKVDLDGTTLGSLLEHRMRQEAERDDVGEGWSNGVLPDQHGRPVKLEGLMFTRPDGRYLHPEYVTKRMQQIARRVGLLTNVRQAAPAGALDLVVGTRYRPVEGEWTLYTDREAVGRVTVVGVTQMRGLLARLHLAEPLPVALGVGDELGERLLSRRRLHDLRHSSASIQLDQGVDITLVSKRMGHSNTSITGNLYVHLLRSSGQKAAETVSAAVPRSARRGLPAGTSGQRSERPGPSSPVSAGSSGDDEGPGFIEPSGGGGNRTRPEADR